jgi:hypothetical protein
METLMEISAATPEWLAEEMPPGYRNRIEEIGRLTKELQAMWPFGRLLWATGPQLSDTVRDVFTALKFEVESIPSGDTSFLAVRLEGNRRLLVYVSPSRDAVEKKGADVAAVFQMLHELADENDRGILVINPHGTLPPNARPEGLSPDALAIVKRLGVNVLSGPSVFQLWTLAAQDPERASRFIELLHEQDGGMFTVLPPAKA